MSRIDSPIKPLGEVGTFIRGNGLQKSDLTDHGAPAIHYGQIHTYYGTWANQTASHVPFELAQRLRRAQPGDLVIATTSEDDAAVAKATAWLGDEDAAVSGDAYIYRHTLDPRYVSHYFQSTQFQDQKRRYITGTKVRRISGDALAKILIPVPPLQVQQEIAQTLDRLSDLHADLETELDAELESRRLEYEHHRNCLMSFPDGEPKGWATLGEVCTHVTSGGTPSSGHAAYYGGNIPWLRTQEVDYNEIRSTGMTITEEGLKNSSAKWIPEHCVIVAMYGATAAKVAVNSIPLTTNQACCNLQIDPVRADYRYVFHWIAKEYWHLRALGEGSQSNLNAKKVKSYPIPIPPLGKQREIALILDSYDALLSDLSGALLAERTARRQQYEYHRDKLLAFKELTA